MPARAMTASPCRSGAALLGARVGDDVMRERPIGLLSLTVVAIDAGRISSSKAWKYR